MCELTLEALGYRRDEAAIARRMHVLLHETAVAQPLPAWLQRKAPWSLVTRDGVVTRGVVMPIRPAPGASKRSLEQPA